MLYPFSPLLFLAIPLMPNLSQFIFSCVVLELTSVNFDIQFSFTICSIWRWISILIPVQFFFNCVFNEKWFMFVYVEYKAKLHIFLISKKNNNRILLFIFRNRYRSHHEKKSCTKIRMKLIFNICFQITGNSPTTELYNVSTMIWIAK